MKSAAMRRVSSLLRGRGLPAGASFPFTSTSGGFPGEKKRSLILAEVLSIDASNSGVESGAGAGAAAAAAPVAAGTGFGNGFAGEDIWNYDESAFMEGRDTAWRLAGRAGTSEARDPSFRTYNNAKAPHSHLEAR